MSPPTQEKISLDSLSLTTKPTKNFPKQRKASPRPAHDDEEITITSFPSFSTPLSVPEMANPLRLLVCSIGNPAPYTNTLHSAGHTVLNVLASSLSYPPFQKSGNGLVSQGSEYTLWQSRSLMNVSGAGVSAAWRKFQKENNGEALLVVVHDELELPVGEVKVRDGAASPKGHNGLKDIKRLVQGKWVRIGVGIGRPESREPAVVANYVLRKMSGGERAKIEGAVGRIQMELRKLGGV